MVRILHIAYRVIILHEGCDDQTEKEVTYIASLRELNYYYLSSADLVTVTPESFCTALLVQFG
jgi:hypothetical protein